MSRNLICHSFAANEKADSACRHTGRTSGRSGAPNGGRARGPPLPALLLGFSPSRPVAQNPRPSIGALPHRITGLPTPMDDERVRATTRGILRSLGTAPEKKVAATAEMIRATLPPASENLEHLRDRARRLLGFAVAFRRSELVALDDVEEVARDCTSEFGTARPIRRGAVRSLRSRASPLPARSRQSRHGLRRRLRHRSDIQANRKEWAVRGGQTDRPPAWQRSSHGTQRAPDSMRGTRCLRTLWAMFRFPEKQPSCGAPGF